MPEIVRIGNVQGFWGDRSDAAAEMLSLEPDLDYLTLDYLAEVSMSILASQRARDPSAGYARDFVDVVRSLSAYWASGGRCRIITNAGGLNPSGCAVACARVLEETGCRPLKIAIVSGDDVLPLLKQVGDEAAAYRDSETCRNLETGAPLTDVLDRLVTANAYLGAGAAAEALAAGADIVITGRVADPSMTVAACLHAFGWSPDDWDRLAGATVAGHLIECGTQSTGGISTDWLSVPDLAHIGFPIAEIAADGSCVLTKPRGTGGAVTDAIVKEQLLYEIGDPDSYLSPDVTVSFLGLAVQQIGTDRVRVSGARGRPAPPTLKVSATFRDGYWAAGTLTIVGRDALAKARHCGEIVFARLREAGCELKDSLIECFHGTETSLSPAHPADAQHSEVEVCVLRVAAAAETSEAVERFARELMPMITAGPPGTTGYAAGRPRVHPVFRYWPCLIRRDAVAPRIDFVTTRSGASVAPGTVPGPRPSPRTLPPAGHAPERPPHTLQPRQNDAVVRVRDVAVARSGDKGTSANIGVIARDPRDYGLLRDRLTAERVADYFRPMGVTDVVRYELPNLAALNFILKGILRNSLRTDAQGKGLAQRLLDLRLE